ncbi:hypothetical protein [uncultured Methanobrevibacter sp.]|nr:hypothetical protein [uncultured Methanobrevibacter sp.]
MNSKRLQVSMLMEKMETSGSIKKTSSTEPWPLMMELWLLLDTTTGLMQ